MTNISPAPTPTTDAELAPFFAIPSVLIIAGIALVFVQPWVGGAIAVFGIVLTVQTATIRLHFTETALDVYRSGTRIRHFPYAEWQHWEIFWPGFPILFYFREVKSIHFLPVLFEPSRLHACLAERCPRR